MKLKLVAQRCNVGQKILQLLWYHLKWTQKKLKSKFSQLILF